MNTATKLLDAMRNNPRDWRMAQLLTVARQFDIETRNDGGSHHVFAHAAVPGIVTVPAHRPIKPVYVRQFLALIQARKGVTRMNAIKNIARTTAPWPFEAYAHVISRISDEDGGGYLITFPDLPGCMADGQTEAEAVENGRDAFAATLSALADMGRDIPAPAFVPDDMTAFDASGKFLTRVPKSIHARLSTRAKAEDVSLNTLVLTFITEGLSRREKHA